MKYTIITADPPYGFSDKLTMDKNIARGAEANYPILKEKDLLNLKIKDIAADDAVLALWVPSSLLPLGMDLVKAYGFVHKQTYIWAKTKKDPFDKIKKSILKSKDLDTVKKIISEDLNTKIISNSLSFGMGRTFRNCHEVALIGTRGKILSKLNNKSQRTVSFAPVEKHSKKPEDLQDSLDLMFPDFSMKRIEIFARRSRPNWTCVGFDSPQTPKQDIRDIIEKLINE